MIGRGNFNSNKMMGFLSAPKPVEYKPIKRGQVYTPTYSSYATPEPEKNLLIPENDPYKVIGNYQTRLQSVGQEIPERKNTSLGNVLMTALDVMQRPQYAVTNALQDLTDTKKDTVGDIAKGMLEGLSGKRKSSITDTFTNLGWENNKNKKWYDVSGGLKSNLSRNILGFLGDVAVDPTTYVSFGSIKSFSKMTGKKGVKEGLEKALVQSTDDIATVASRIAKPLGKSVDDVMALAAKHGNQSETVMRIADVLSNKPVYKGIDDVTKNVVVDHMMDSDRIANILEQGLDYVNKDAISDYLKNTSKATQGLGAELAGKTGLSARTNRSLGSFFPELNKKGSDYNIRKILDTNFEEGQNILQDLANVFSSDTFKLRRFSDEEAEALITKIYAGKNAANVKFKYGAKYFSDRELGVLDILVNQFGVDKSTPLVDTAEKIIDSMSTTGKKAKSIYRDPSSLLEKVAMEGKVWGEIKKIDGGVQFANGLQRVYDDVAKKFMFRYDNPFTGKVTPIADLSKYIDPVKEKASAFITNNKPLRTVADAIGSIFQPEHISTAFKADNEIYSAAKTMAQRVSKTLHEETGIPQKALEASIGLFKDIPEFLTNEKLRKAAVYFIERENDDWARIAWKYIEGTLDTDLLDDIGKKAYDQLAKNNVFKYLDSIKITDVSDMDMIKKVAGKVEMFNTERLRTDLAHGIVFGKGDENTISNVVGYLKHVYEGDEDAIMQLLASRSPIDAAGMSMNAMLDSANKRSLQSLAMQKAVRPDLKAVDDVIASMALRESDSLKVELNKRFYTSIADSLTGSNGVEKIDGLDSLFYVGKGKPKVTKTGIEMSPIKIGTDTSGKPIIIWAVPEMVGQINRITKVFTTNKGQKEILKWYDEVTNVMKTLQTTANPAFNARNAIGETMMNWFAGVDLRAHKEATEILKQINQIQDVVRVGDGFFYKGKPMYRIVKKDMTRSFTDEATGKVITEVVRKNADAVEYITKATRDTMGDAITWADANTAWLDAVSNVTSVTKKINKDYGIKLYKIGENELSAHDLMDLFRTKGLGWSGITKGNLIRNTQAAIKDEIRGLTGNAGQQAFQTLKDTGDYIETWTRFSHFLDRLKKGMSIDDAVSDVRLYHVDYRNLTNIERTTFRRLMPYYTYMRKNLPIQMNNLLGAYNKVGIVTHLVDSSYQTLERQNNGQPLVVDDYLREGLALPLDIDKNGNIIYLNWNLPINDLSRLKYNIGDFFNANLMDMLSPLIRSGFEFSSNTNLRFGTPIEKFEGEKSPLLPNVEGSPQVVPKYVDYMLQQLGAVNTLRQSVGQGLNQITGAPEDPLRPNNPLAYLGLQSFIPIRSQQNAANNQAYDYRDQLQDYIKLLQSQGKYIPTVDEAKKRSFSLFGKYTP